MSNVTQVIKELTLDLSDIPRKDRAEAKTEVRNFIINEVLRSVEKGVSPVAGEGRFRILQPDYAKKMKGGVQTANLQLEGDLLDALKGKNLAGSKIEIGVRGKQAPKADGHNQISAEAKAWAAKNKRTQYKRRFIPDDAQNFAPSIMSGVTSILDSFRKVEEEVSTIEAGAVSSATTTVDTERVEVSNMFSDDAISALLQEALERRGF